MENTSDMPQEQKQNFPEAQENFADSVVLAPQTPAADATPFVSRFNQWMKVIAIVVLAAFVPNQASWAFGYNPSVLYRNLPVAPVQDEEGIVLPQPAMPGVQVADSMEYLLKQIQNKPKLRLELNLNAGSKAHTLEIDTKTTFTPDKITRISQWLKTPNLNVLNCGVYALKDILEANGIKRSLQEVSVMTLSVDIMADIIKVGEPKLKTTLFAINKTAQALGLKYQSLKVLPQDELNLPTPFIAHFKNEHFVTVQKAVGGEVYYTDLDYPHIVKAGDFLKNADGFVLAQPTEGITAKAVPESLQAFVWGDKWRDMSQNLPGIVSGAQLGIQIAILVLRIVLSFVPYVGTGIEFAMFAYEVSQLAQALATICVMKGACSQDEAFLLSTAITAAFTSGSVLGFAMSIGEAYMDKEIIEAINSAICPHPSQCSDTSLILESAADVAATSVANAAANAVASAVADAVSNAVSSGSGTDPNSGGPGPSNNGSPGSGPSQNPPANNAPASNPGLTGPAGSPVSSPTSPTPTTTPTPLWADLLGVGNNSSSPSVARPTNFFEDFGDRLEASFYQQLPQVVGDVAGMTARLIAYKAFGVKANDNVSQALGLAFNAVGQLAGEEIDHEISSTNPNNPYRNGISSQQLWGTVIKASIDLGMGFAADAAIGKYDDKKAKENAAYANNYAYQQAEFFGIVALTASAAMAGYMALTTDVPANSVTGKKPGFLDKFGLALFAPGELAASAVTTDINGKPVTVTQNIDSNTPSVLGSTAVNFGGMNYAVQSVAPGTPYSEVSGTAPGSGFTDVWQVDPQTGKSFLKVDGLGNYMNFMQVQGQMTGWTPERVAGDDMSWNEMKKNNKAVYNAPGHFDGLISYTPATPAASDSELHDQFLLGEFESRSIGMPGLAPDYIAGQFQEAANEGAFNAFSLGMYAIADRMAKEYTPTGVDHLQNGINVYSTGDAAGGTVVGGDYNAQTNTLTVAPMRDFLLSIGLPDFQFAATESGQLAIGQAHKDLN
ncbi:MAG: hypothetical protein KGJ11_07475, partial [Candidatus Omnitrophica bacterium]|nr:hypothetical protein [Candidatus Omnitrophota bacterium]